MIDIQTPDEQAAGVLDLREWHVVELSLEHRVEIVVLHLETERHTGSKLSNTNEHECNADRNRVVTLLRARY
eukprot:SAG22_NODE_8994_length_616_cov_0.468085_1_plen_72_part_00